jgi:hypothetical protein
MQRAVAKCDRYQTRGMFPSKTTRWGDAACRLSPCEVEGNLCLLNQNPEIALQFRGLAVNAK